MVCLGKVFLALGQREKRTGKMGAAGEGGQHHPRINSCINHRELFT
jgi:hypothetical protein